MIFRNLKMAAGLLPTHSCFPINTAGIFEYSLCHFTTKKNNTNKKASNNIIIKNKNNIKEHIMVFKHKKHFYSIEWVGGLKKNM